MLKMILRLLSIIFSIWHNDLKAQLLWTDCVDATGKQVILSVVPGANDFYATVQNGQPYIIWNPDIASRLSPQTQTFFYAHECAHHVLGHPYVNIPITREKEADCWAIKTLTSRGVIDKPALSKIQNEISELPGDFWVYLPGPKRAIFLENCSELSEDINYDVNSEILDENACTEENVSLGCEWFINQAKDSLSSAKEKYYENNYGWSMSLSEAAIMASQTAYGICKCTSNIREAKERKSDSIESLKKAGKKNGYSDSKLLKIIENAISEGNQ
jgi:hypothetical protein